jgi:hypothetical protein
MDTENLKTLMSGIMTAEKLIAGKKAYQNKTVESMRDDVINRAALTLEALRAYEGGTFKAPMARSVRNGIAIKIGYGNKNECLMDFGIDDKGKRVTELRCNGFSHGERKEQAVTVFEKVIPMIKNGSLDYELSQKLDGFRIRAEKGKAKVRLVDVPVKHAA